MERHNTELEGNAGHQEDQTENQYRRICGISHQGIGDIRDTEGAGSTINHGHAVEQQARGQSTQNKVLHGGFGGGHTVTVHGDQCINRQGKQLDAQIHHQQVIGRDHDHHAQGGKKHQNIELSTTQIGSFQHVRTRIEQGDDDRQIEDQLQEIAHQVVDIQTVKGVNHLTCAGK